VAEVPQKKLKKCEDEQVFGQEKEESVLIKTEPTAEEEKQIIPEQVDCTSNEQLFHKGISTTFPETPPSFELDAIEQETKESET